ncbi:hypothetical protein H5410_052237 [Solanum commersonii]|uniref:DUF4283 domain-containing protein n=1 Tax=Solanum commersonii TaxID=4109 RepID=A0A9J5X0V9_SOLCO|nr:hypothetical protein H5410_052237 [Solanum commersonii]
MDTNFNPKEETSKALVWVSLSDLPPNIFARKPLLSIASPIGKPLTIDKSTQDRTRPSTTRVKQGDKANNLEQLQGDKRDFLNAKKLKIKSLMIWIMQEVLLVPGTEVQEASTRGSKTLDKVQGYQEGDACVISSEGQYGLNAVTSRKLLIGDVTINTDATYVAPNKRTWTGSGITTSPLHIGRKLVLTCTNAQRNYVGDKELLDALVSSNVKKLTSLMPINTNKQLQDVGSSSFSTNRFSNLQDKDIFEESEEEDMLNYCFTNATRDYGMLVDLCYLDYIP